MSDPTRNEGLLRAVRDLAAARPHEPAGVHLTAADYVTYCRGYWAALCAVVAIIDAETDRTAARERAALRGARRAVARNMRRLLTLPARCLYTHARRGAA